MTIASEIGRPDDTARLESPEVASNSGFKCLSFYYHMKGVHINRLNVKLKKINSNEELSVWAKQGNQGNSWINGRVNILLNDSYTIIFEAVRGNGYLVFNSINKLGLFLN